MNDLKIIVKDYGPGLKNHDGTEENLGFQIVKTLIESELSGTINYKKNDPQGLVVEIALPLA